MSVVPWRQNSEVEKILEAVVAGIPRVAKAIAEAVQRPTMKFVATKTADQLDPQALHRVRERVVSQRTSIINQIRAFLLERGVAVQQGTSALDFDTRVLLDLLFY